VNGAIEGGQQLELLPALPIRTRRASLHLADLAGYENARPRRELVESIARLGLLEPVLVAGSARDRYTVLEGRRRVKALALLAEEGRDRAERLEVIIVDGGDRYGDPTEAVITLATHAVRSSAPVSELAAIEALIAAGGEEAQTVKRIAREIGMPEQTVQRRLRLRRLNVALRASFERGELGATIAEAAARLSSEQQEQLEQMLAAGERVTLAAVKEIARERTRQAAVALDAGLFSDRSPSWRATVRGHLRAALDALPAAETDGDLAGLIGDALAHAERRS
jgi:ParB-like chromosome segregation protein Spo0J